MYKCRDRTFNIFVWVFCLEKVQGSPIGRQDHLSIMNNDGVRRIVEKGLITTLCLFEISIIYQSADKPRGIALGIQVRRFS
jgi:hypothetical protein